MTNNGSLLGFAENVEFVILANQYRDSILNWKENNSMSEYTALAELEAVRSDEAGDKKSGEKSGEDHGTIQIPSSGPYILLIALKIYKEFLAHDAPKPINVR